jgi:RHS repeat-associated protein
MSHHPITTLASPSPASPLFDASFDFIESHTTSFTAYVVPTIETTTVTEVALGYHRNQQYSITAITTSTDTVADRYAYMAFGQPTILNASGTVLTSSAVGNRYTYTGREWDETLGLHHFRARWMSPLAGRFLGRDPIGYLGSPFNAHEFFESKSLSVIDPIGLWIAPPFLKLDPDRFQPLLGPKGPRDPFSGIGSQLAAMCASCCSENSCECASDSFDYERSLNEIWNTNYGDGPQVFERKTRR